MRTIWKTIIPRLIASATGFNVQVPMGAKPLAVQVQDGRVCVWWLVSPTEPRVDDRTVWLVGIGHEVPDEAKHYIGTIQEGSFVWHFFTQARG